MHRSTQSTSGTVRDAGRPAAARGGSTTERLDEAKLETLRGWGAGLANAPSDELRAAGRAIVLLVEEIDSLYVDLWNVRTADGGFDGDGKQKDETEPHIEQTLWQRIRAGRERA